MDILNFLKTHIFLIVWIIFFLVIFVLAYFEIKLESLSIIVGLIVTYILLFPIFTRISIFLTLDAVSLKSTLFAVILLLIFIILFIFTLWKQFAKGSKENRIIKNFVSLFDQGYKAIFSFIIKFKVIEKVFFLPVMNFVYRNIETDKKKLYFYIIFNAMPKSIFFFSLLYDINMLQKLHYSLYFSILLLFPIIFNFYFKMLTLYAQESLDGLHTYLHVVYEFEFDEELRDAMLRANLDPEKHGRFTITLKRPHLEEVTEEWFDERSLEVFCRLNTWSCWSHCTKDFFTQVVYFRFTIIFLTIQILCQLTIIINQW